MRTFYCFKATNHKIRFSVDCDPKILSKIYSLHYWLEHSLEKTTVKDINFNVSINEIDQFNDTNHDITYFYGNSLGKGENKIVYTLENWLRIEIHFELFLKINIQYILVKPHKLKDIVKSLLNRRMLRSINEERIIRAMRFSLHFPIFYFLKKLGSYEIYHGSVVANKDRCLALMGFDGVGKTTSAVGLVKWFDYELLSDNFTILDESGFVVPFVDNLRLNNDSVLKLGLNRFRKIRNRIALNPEDLGIPISKKRRKVTHIHLLKRAISHETTSINKTTLLRDLSFSMHHLLPEFVEQNIFFSLMTLNETVDFEHFKSNFDKFKVSELVMSKLADLPTTLKAIHNAY